MSVWRDRLRVYEIYSEWCDHLREITRRKIQKWSNKESSKNRSRSKNHLVVSWASSWRRPIEAEWHNPSSSCLFVDTVVTTQIQRWWPVTQKEKGPIANWNKLTFSGSYSSLKEPNPCHPYAQSPENDGHRYCKLRKQQQDISCHSNKLKIALVIM